MQPLPMFSDHPGGTTTLNLARHHSRPDILFLSSHLGVDLHGRVASVARSKGVQDVLTKTGPLYDRIHEAILHISKQQRRHVNIYRGWCLFLTLALLPAAAAFIWTGGLLSMLALSFLMLSYSFNIFHIRHHRGGTVYGIPWLDKITAPLYHVIDSTFMVTPAAWIGTHNGSHHVFPNDPELDYDLFETSKAGLRLHDKQRREWFHSLQPYYIVPLMMLHIHILPVRNLFQGKGNIVYFALYYALVYVAPWYRNGFEALYNALFVMSISSSLISFLFQVSHNHSSLRSKQDMTTIDKWLRWQMEESMSWGGYIACLLFGGINYQIEHHVAPCLVPTLYHFLAPELERIAKEHGIHYVKEETFWDALAAYHARLFELG